MHTHLSLNIYSHTQTHTPSLAHKHTQTLTYVRGSPQVTLTLDLKEKTLKFAHGGTSIGTIVGVQGPLHAAATVTSSRQQVLRGLCLCNLSKWPAAIIDFLDACICHHHQSPAAAGSRYCLGCEKGLLLYVNHLDPQALAVLGQ